MSLLIDALRRAEEAKRQAGPDDNHASSPRELSLDPFAAPATPAGIEPPPLFTERDAAGSERASLANPRPLRGTSAKVDAGDPYPGAAAARTAASNVFAVKLTAKPHNALRLFLGLGGLATLAIGGYVWWQLQTIASTTLTRPSAMPTESPRAVALPASPPDVSIVAPAETPLPTVAPLHAAAEPRSLAIAARSPRPRREAIQQRQTPGVFRPGKQQGGQDQALEVAYAAWQEGRLEEARRDYEQVLQRDARHADALLGLAAIATRQGQVERAQDFYLRVLDSDPSDATAQAALINLRSQSDAGRSESRLKSLLASQPDSPALHFALGNVYAGQGRWSDAQPAYFQAYVLDPDNADYLFNVAVSLDHLRQSKLAAQYYRMALSAADRGRGAFDRTAAGQRILELQP